MDKKIFLVSDQVIHWNIIPSDRQKKVLKETWGSASTIKILDCLQAYFNQQGKNNHWLVDTADQGVDPESTPFPGDGAYNHVFATWKQYSDGQARLWRIQEMVQAGKAQQPAWDPAYTRRMKATELIIFQDWGLNIRHSDPGQLTDAIHDRWVIYRTYPPVFEGVLWQAFARCLGAKHILLLRADDIRQLNTSISKGLSWEATIQDIVKEIYIKPNILLHPLRTAEYVLISFGCMGTLMLHNPVNRVAADPQIQFYFDAMGGEGAWEKAHPGYLPGDLELLAGLLAGELLFHVDGTDSHLSRAIRAHLVVRRAMTSSGASTTGGTLALDCLPAELDKVYGEKQIPVFKPVCLDYPIFQHIKGEKFENSPHPHAWSLLGLTRWDLYSLARQIALNGPLKALQNWNIPIARYNNLLTVDRKEIEFLHHLKQLISEYLLNRSNQPLSIAVFGPPGSGKSFSIKQLAKALDMPEFEVKDITFNLSQFNEGNPADLYQAFHAVRDIALSGKTPLVFWDEFDSKNLAWLRYFLAPMQDGEFQEGQLIHYIGKAIFVFAGGTCACMEEFESKAYASVAEKGPDFVSRIKGFINVMGPNPVVPFQLKLECDHIPEGEMFNLARNADPEYLIRRAILINSLLQNNSKNLFKENILQIDDGILNALLLVPRYKHGTRSMETIFKTSQLFGKEMFHRSDLPPESQMNLHVDGHQFYELLTGKQRYLEGGEAFYHLVNEISLDEKLIEKMAAGIHAMYSLIFSTGRQNEPLSITKEEFLAAWEQMKALPGDMPHDEVSQNYHNARKIPEKLTGVGLAIVPTEAKITPAEISPENLERVSQLEHIRWVRHHIDSGWSYAPQKDKTRKQHDALVAWDDAERQMMDAVYGECYARRMGSAPGEFLAERYRNLDRVISLAIPWILEQVGYKIVKLPDKG